MKFHTIFAYVILATSVPRVLGWPGMRAALSDIQKAAAKRQDVGTDPADGGADPPDGLDGDDGADGRNDTSGILLGDLRTLHDSQLTPVGADIKTILLGNGTGLSNEIDYSIPQRLGTPECAADVCCVWKWISYNMIAAFRSPSGKCTSHARAAVRMGFHDAGAWSNTSDYGGADGSILLTDELNRTENNGLQEYGAVLVQWYLVYKKFGVSMADLIQFSATLAVVVCPLGPRIKTYVGRKDNPTPAPPGLLPDVNASADELISLFNNKTIAPHELAALLGAHTTSSQDFVNSSLAGYTQDSTPGVWDVLFYEETLGDAPAHVFKFPSDVKISQDPRTADEWAAFVNNQPHWNNDFATSYVRLSLLGVQNINELSECTKVLPAAQTKYNSPDLPILEPWLQGQYAPLNFMTDLAGLLADITSLLASNAPSPEEQS